MTTYNLTVFPGDGIGPEIVDQGLRVLEWVEEAYGVKFDIHTDLLGGISYDTHGLPLTEAALAKAQASDAVLMGSVGGPKWDGKTDYDKRPEQGLLNLRKGLNVFANLRPAYCFDALADASSLKKELVAGLDMLIVRELAGGVYFGEPRGINTLEDGTREGINTQRYHESEISRIARVGFEMAQKRGGRLVSAEKSNVMESGLLWREVVTAVATDYPDVELSHMLADNCAMQIVRAPKQFDVIVTDNLFGDLLSDEAAMLTGSLGMLPSASLSDEGPGLYEPIHGSAPDIAGQDLANPIATILSFAMALRYSLNLGDAATAIEHAVSVTLDQGYRTADIMSEGMKSVGTKAMGDALLAALRS
ncbi:3-isopropylmalate dehydrogenase [Temperatibacter marinus]|uniref:3-isopropylmalate dehydrogenase n=1 Tax=Temperatibacter marinus TaxID=1456591 RepID=A0AA52H876_9PROT|nr:3-isopropylmalate dehydrogenase [Temperatibacter marinus]WND01836.1 3-isopropylmalate dehydrogenase [Temperatibacter marinus]